MLQLPREAMGKADLHIHTDQGDGLDSVSVILDHVERKTDLDVIAITEHDSLQVALEAREIWAKGGYRFDFVPGMEVTTLDGHLIALYVEEPVPSLRRLEETVEVVERQGGICFAPHPLSRLTRSIGESALKRIFKAGGRIHGLELATASPTRRFYVEKARRLNDACFGMPTVGASDAHFVEAIGSAWTRFAGGTAAELRLAFESGAIGGDVAAFPRLRDVGLVRTLALPLKGLGATPRRLGWRRTAWSFVSRGSA
jgi:predicted metal-dependent phosphoesterase TrpH